MWHKPASKYTQLGLYHVYAASFHYVNGQFFVPRRYAQRGLCRSKSKKEKGAYSS